VKTVLLRDIRADWWEMPASHARLRRNR